MFSSAVFICLGYLSGSVLYARIFAILFKKDNMLDLSKDHNPGTANAFLYGGFWCGLLTLIFDLLKGFFPIFLYMHYGTAGSSHPFATALVIAAPVIGHIFRCFTDFAAAKASPLPSDAWPACSPQQIPCSSSRFSSSHFRPC